jgi:hypothetical protein
MPSKTEDQAIAARIAYAVKKGKLPRSKLKGASKSMYKSMTLGQLRDFMKTKG